MDISTTINEVGQWFCKYNFAMLVQSSVLIAVLLVLDLIIKKRVRAVVRYCIWMLVLVKLVLPTSLSMPTGLGYWAGDPIAEMERREMLRGGSEESIDSGRSAEDGLRDGNGELKTDDGDIAEAARAESGLINADGSLRIKTDANGGATEGLRTAADGGEFASGGAINGMPKAGNDVIKNSELKIKKKENVREGIGEASLDSRKYEQVNSREENVRKGVGNSKSVIGKVSPAAETNIMAGDGAKDINQISWQGWVFMGWVVGVLILVSVLVQRYWFVRSLIEQSEVISAGRLKDTLEECREKVGLGRKVELRLTRNMMSPAACGLVRPVILLPEELLAKLSRDKLRAVLLHELAHIKRGDLWVNLAQTLLQIVYFFSPLLWVANAIIRGVREKAVDEMVVAKLEGDAAGYSTILLDIAEIALSRPHFSLRLVGVVESKKALTDRIKHILSRTFPGTAKVGIAGMVSVLILAVVLLPMAGAKDAKSRYTFELEDGQKIELVGVCDRNLEKTRWHTPDGMPIELKIQTDDKKLTASEYPEYYLAFKADKDISYKIDKVKGCNVNAMVRVQEPENISVYKVFIDGKYDKTDVTIAVQDENWKIECERNFAIGSTTHEVDRKPVVLGGIQSGNNIIISCSDNVGYKKVSKVVVYDKDGKEIPGEVRTDTGFNNVRQRTIEYTNVMPDDIGKVAFLTCSYIKHTFKKVNLKDEKKKGSGFRGQEEKSEELRTKSEEYTKEAVGNDTASPKVIDNATTKSTMPQAASEEVRVKSEELRDPLAAEANLMPDGEGNLSLTTKDTKEKIPASEKVKLIGTCTWPENGKKWINQDGNELEINLRTTDIGGCIGLDEGACYQFAFEVDVDTGLKVESIEGGKHCYQQEVRENTKNIIVFRAITDKNLAMTDIKVSAPNNEWKTVKKRKFIVGVYNDTIKGNTCSLATMQSGSGLVVTATTNVEKGKEKRIALIDKKGKIITAKETHDTLDGDTLKQILEFENVKPDDIEYLAHQECLREFVTFENVCLKKKENNATTEETEGTEGEKKYSNSKTAKIVQEDIGFTVGEAEKLIKDFQKAIENKDIDRMIELHYTENDKHLTELKQNKNNIWEELSKNKLDEIRVVEINKERDNNYKISTLLKYNDEWIPQIIPAKTQNETVKLNLFSTKRIEWLKVAKEKSAEEIGKDSLKLACKIWIDADGKELDQLYRSQIEKEIKHLRIAEYAERNKIFIPEHFREKAIRERIAEIRKKTPEDMKQELIKEYEKWFGKTEEENQGIGNSESAIGERIADGRTELNNSTTEETEGTEGGIKNSELKIMKEEEKLSMEDIVGVWESVGWACNQDTFMTPNDRLLFKYDGKQAILERYTPEGIYEIYFCIVKTNNKITTLECTDKSFVPYDSDELTIELFNGEMDILFPVTKDRCLFDKIVSTTTPETRILKRWLLANSVSTYIGNWSLNNSLSGPDKEERGAVSFKVNGKADIELVENGNTDKLENLECYFKGGFIEILLGSTVFAKCQLMWDNSMKVELTSPNWVLYADRITNEKTTLTEADMDSPGGEAIDDGLKEFYEMPIEEIVKILAKAEDLKNWPRYVRASYVLTTKYKNLAVTPLCHYIKISEDPIAQSLMAFTLRAIGDWRAVDSLIDALENAQIEGDMSNWKLSPVIDEYWQKNQYDNSRYDELMLGCPAREITIALERLTGHSEGHEHLRLLDENGNKPANGSLKSTDAVKEAYNARCLEVAQRWRTWWAKQEKPKVEDTHKEIYLKSSGSFTDMHNEQITGNAYVFDLASEEILEYKNISDIKKLTNIINRERKGDVIYFYDTAKKSPVIMLVRDTREADKPVDTSVINRFFSPKSYPNVNVITKENKTYYLYFREYDETGCLIVYREIKPGEKLPRTMTVDPESRSANQPDQILIEAQVIKCDQGQDVGLKSEKQDIIDIDTAERILEKAKQKRQIEVLSAPRLLTNDLEEAKMIAGGMSISVKPQIVKSKNTKLRIDFQHDIEPGEKYPDGKPIVYTAEVHSEIILQNSKIGVFPLNYGGGNKGFLLIKAFDLGDFRVSSTTEEIEGVEEKIENDTKDEMKRTENLQDRKAA